MKTSKRLYMVAAVCYVIGAITLANSLIMIFKYKKSFMESAFLSGFAMVVSASSMVVSGKTVKGQEDLDARKERLEREIEEAKQKAS